MKKSIRYFIGSFSVGGAERHLSYIIPLLIKRGWTVRLFLLAPVVKLPIPKEVIIRQPPRVFHSSFVLVRILRNFWCFFTAIWEYLRYPTKINHYFLPEAYVVGMVASFFSPVCGLRIMSRRSLNHYKNKRPFVGYLENYFHKFIDAALGNSQAVVSDLLQEGIPEKKVSLIYNGIPRVADRIATKEGPRLELIVLANLIAYKGHEDLIRALTYVSFPKPWRLTCVGRDGGVLSHLTNVAEKCGVLDNIEFVGQSLDAPSYLYKSHIGVLPSHEEGFSNALLEMMWSGLPTVVTDVGGNAEAVIHNQTGIIVPAHSPKAMAAAIQMYVDNPIVAQQHGKAARLRAETLFSLDKCVDAYELFYKRCEDKKCAG